MIDDKEFFIQRMETLSEIARNTEMRARRLFREIERICEEYEKRWPQAPANIQQQVQADYQVNLWEERNGNL